MSVAVCAKTCGRALADGWGSFWNNPVLRGLSCGAGWVIGDTWASTTFTKPVEGPEQHHRRKALCFIHCVCHSRALAGAVKQVGSVKPGVLCAGADVVKACSWGDCCGVGVTLAVASLFPLRQEGGLPCASPQWGLTWVVCGAGVCWGGSGELCASLAAWCGGLSQEQPVPR